MSFAVVLTAHSPIRGSRGLSLVELLVAVTIAGILAAIAPPLYNRLIDKARMTEGETAVVEVRALQEPYFASTHTYSTDLSALGYSPTPPLKYYALEIVLGNPQEPKPPVYQVVAIPKRPSLDAWYLTVYADGTEELWHQSYAESSDAASADSPAPVAASSPDSPGPVAASSPDSPGPVAPSSPDSPAPVAPSSPPASVASSSPDSPAPAASSSKDKKIKKVRKKKGGRRGED
jgi:prepilin-type N-terminal cleavage/methylation domain-containing protein